MTPYARITRGRRELAYAAVACLAGAGLAAFAVTRTWAVEEGFGAAPLPPPGRRRSGGDLLPWLPALAVVGVAGAGALLATRGLARLAAGVLLAGCGLGLVGGAGQAVTGKGVGAGWPALTALGGLALATGGAFAVLRGRRWPAMGARYDRRPAAGAPAAAGAAPTSLDAWSALDRGEDPTADPSAG
jgi:hypothetical protein